MHFMGVVKGIFFKKTDIGGVKPLPFFRNCIIIETIFKRGKIYLYILPNTEVANEADGNFEKEYLFLVL